VQAYLADHGLDAIGQLPKFEIHFVIAGSTDLTKDAANLRSSIQLSVIDLPWQKALESDGPTEV